MIFAGMKWTERMLYVFPEYGVATALSQGIEFRIDPTRLPCARSNTRAKFLEESYRWKCTKEHNDPLCREAPSPTTGCLPWGYEEL